jgi:single-stranded DNA-binding protein
MTGQVGKGPYVNARQEKSGSPKVFFRLGIWHRDIVLDPDGETYRRAVKLTWHPIMCFWDCAADVAQWIQPAQWVEVVGIIRQRLYPSTDGKTIVGYDIAAQTVRLISVGAEVAKRLASGERSRELAGIRKYLEAEAKARELPEPSPDDLAAIDEFQP